MVPPATVPLSDIAHTIQLALAPVFLLTGIGSILNILTGRLSRIVDHARLIESLFTPPEHPDHQQQVRKLRLLDRRMMLVNSAIFQCTMSAMLICVVVAGLFVADLLSLGFGRVLAGGFVLAMLLLISALMLFLYEVRIAVRAIQINDALLERE